MAAEVGDGGTGTGQPVPGIWAYRTPEYHDAILALMDGTTRARLAAGFETSGLSLAELAARVGHDELTAKRVVSGDALLSEGTVAVYFKAMGVTPGQAAMEAYRAEQKVLRGMEG